jgi:hypothetical protein
MDTNILKIGLLITATQFLLANSCNKNGSQPCRDAQYSFTVTSEFSPQQEVYNIGDTIFFTSTFPKSLTNLISNQQVDYSNSLGIGGSIAFVYMDTVSQSVIQSYPSFTVIPYIGTFSQIINTPNKGINTLYMETNTYDFKIGIVVNQKGLYFMSVLNLSSQGLQGKNCTNAGFNMTVTNSDKHLNLFEYALNYYPDALLQKGTYCFRVQ